MTKAIAATRRPYKTIRQIERIFADKRGPWCASDLARMTDRSEASVREALRTLTHQGITRRLGRTTWVSASEFDDLVVPPAPPPPVEIAPTTIDRDRLTMSPLADDLQKAEQRWCRLMEERRFEDVPRIRPLPLFRASPSLETRSSVGSAAAMCAEHRVSLVGR